MRTWCFQYMEMIEIWRLRSSLSLRDMYIIHTTTHLFNHYPVWILIDVQCTLQLHTCTYINHFWISNLLLLRPIIFIHLNAGRNISIILPINLVWQTHGLSSSYRTNITIYLSMVNKIEKTAMHHQICSLRLSQFSNFARGYGLWAGNTFGIIAFTCKFRLKPAMHVATAKLRILTQKQNYVEKYELRSG